MSSTGKIGESSPLTPKSGAGSAGPAEGPPPQKPFEEVMQKDRQGEPDQGDSRRDGEPSKETASKDAASKEAAPRKDPKAEKADPRPKTVAEWRAMRARKQGDPSSDSADALAKQNPALARPMEVRRPAGEDVTPARVDGLISKDKIQQIVESCRVGVNRAGATEMQFDLKSEVLGGLTLKVSTVEGKVYATFLADQPGVKDLVDLNASQLEKALRDRGLAIGEIKTEMRHGLLPDDRQGRGQQGGGQGGGAPGESGGAPVPDGTTRPSPAPSQKETSRDYTV